MPNAVLAKIVEMRLSSGIAIVRLSWQTNDEAAEEGIGIGHQEGNIGSGFGFGRGEGCEA
jgi:hypothetical protein